MILRIKKRLPNIVINQRVRAGKVRISLVSNGGTVAAIGESIHS
jgi:hypothetical protein